MKPKEKPRRTQSERRETTIRKLKGAATDALIDLGYAGATVQAICERAELSQGALFRHFPTREALLVAVCSEIGERVLDDYRSRFRAGATGESPLHLAMELLRAQCGSRINQAFYELAIAARTNPELERALRPVADKYYADIEDLAKELLPGVATALGPLFRVLVDTVVCVFDGEAVHRMVRGPTEVDAARIDILARALTAVVEPDPGPPRRPSDRSPSPS